MKKSLFVIMLSMFLTPCHATAKNDKFYAEVAENDQTYMPYAICFIAYTNALNVLEPLYKQIAPSPAQLEQVNEFKEKQRWLMNQLPRNMTNKQIKSMSDRAVQIVGQNTHFISTCDEKFGFKSSF